MNAIYIHGLCVLATLRVWCIKGSLPHTRSFAIRLGHTLEIIREVPLRISNNMNEGKQNVIKRAVSEIPPVILPNLNVSIELKALENGETQSKSNERVANCRCNTLASTGMAGVASWSMRRLWKKGDATGTSFSNTP